MQRSPSQPGWQTHCPSLHSPCSSQIGWHACLSQVVPSHPSSHWQRPATHTLWALQGMGQTSEINDRKWQREKYICYHSLQSTIDCKKDWRCISTSFHYRKVKPKHSHYLAKMTSFGARVCVVVLVRWSRGIKVPPKLPQTQSQAHNHDTTPHFYSIK